MYCMYGSISTDVQSSSLNIKSTRELDNLDVDGQAGEQNGWRMSSRPEGRRWTENGLGREAASGVVYEAGGIQRLRQEPSTSA